MARLGRAGRIAYGVGRFGSTLMLSLVDLTSFYIYGSMFELNWFLSGLALGVSYVVIGLTHWLTGFYSDRASIWGHGRKPFVIIGAPALATTGALLFMPDLFLTLSSPLVEPYLFAYYLMTLATFKAAYAFLLTAFQAWMPEITDEDERPLVSGYQNTANWSANAIGAALAFIAPPLLFTSTSPAVLTATGKTVVALAALSVIGSYLPSVLLLPAGTRGQRPGHDILSETATIVHNPDYARWVFIAALFALPFSGVIAQAVGFTEEVLGLTTIEDLAFPAAVLLGATVAFLFGWARVIRSSTKKKTLTVATLVLACALFIMPLVPTLVPLLPGRVVAAVFFVPIGAGIAAFYLLNYVVPADFAELDTLRSGVGRAGMFIGLLGIPFNAAQAVGAVLLGAIMGWSEATTGSTAQGLVIWGPLFAPFLLVAVLVLQRTEIDLGDDLATGS